MDKLKKATSYCYRLLQIRPRTEREIGLRLKERGFNQEIIKEVVSFLKRENLIDDLKFAKAWTDSRLRMNPKGMMILREELATKGVSTTIIDKVISKNTVDEKALVRKLAEERIGRLSSLPRVKIKKRLFDYLTRRGFDFDIIEDVINEHIQ